MTTSRDPLVTLTALRPHAAVDQALLAISRTATYEAVTATTRSATEATSRRRRAPRVVAIALLAGLGVAAGIGAAGATGLLPDAFIRNYASWRQDTGVDPATATRVAAAPGPDGTIFTIWIAKGPNGSVCIAPLFETADSAKSPQPSAFHDNGSTCQPPERHESFGASSGINADDKNHTYNVSAGDTARAALRLHDGTVLPAIRVEGNYLGWYPTAHGQTAPVLTAYDIAGNVVARLQLKYLP